MDIFNIHIQKCILYATDVLRITRNIPCVEKKHMAMNGCFKYIYTKFYPKCDGWLAHRTE